MESPFFPYLTAAFQHISTSYTVPETSVPESLSSRLAARQLQGSLMCGHLQLPGFDSGATSCQHTASVQTKHTFNRNADTRTIIMKFDLKCIQDQTHWSKHIGPLRFVLRVCKPTAFPLPPARKLARGLVFRWQFKLYHTPMKEAFSNRM